MAVWRGTKTELMSSNGYLLFTVMFFNNLKYKHGRSVRSFLLMKKNPAPIGEDKQKDDSSSGGSPRCTPHWIPAEVVEVR